MNEPRQLNPMQLDIDLDIEEADFTPRAVASPKGSSAPEFATVSPSEPSPSPAQSPPPSSSEDLPSTPPSSEPPQSLSVSPSSVESPEKNAPAEKAPIPRDIPITRSEYPIPLPGVGAPPRVS